MSIKGQMIKVNDVTLNVYVEGEGPPLLLLHGFPDSNALWRDIIPRLVKAGYKVIAPDQRGFGESDAPQGKQNYKIKTIASDAIAVLDHLGVDKAHLIAHDWGAIIGWYLAGHHGERFHSYTAISVGHPQAYMAAGLEQKLKAWYTVAFQFKWIAEYMFSKNDWANLRKLARHHPEMEHWKKDLSRPGRFTAAINWYRANLLDLLITKTPRASIPVLGVWSSEDVALAEDQMINSKKYVDSSFRYERLDGFSHWVPIDAPNELSELSINFICKLAAGKIRSTQMEP